MFNFGIIICADGTEIIDKNRTTLYSELTPLQMVEYVEMDVQLFIMDMQRRKVMEEAERRRKLTHNPFYRIACMCRLV